MKAFFLIQFNKLLKKCKLLAVCKFYARAKIIQGKPKLECKFAKMKNLRFLVGIFLVLLFPIVCYMLVRKLGGDGHVRLPKYYGGIDSVKEGLRKKLIGSDEHAKDTFWKTVPNLLLTNQLGKPVNLFDDVKGKIVVMDFFFTTCKTTCPTLNNHLKFLQQKYKKVDTALAFASISLDPASDSVPALRAYANAIGANHDKWWFCRGDQQVVKNYMFNHLHLPDMKASDVADDNYLHSNKWVLLDVDRNIRGYYDALDTNEIRRCADDISLLILEKKKKHFSNIIK
jgi:protein SCO1